MLNAYVFHFARLFHSPYQLKAVRAGDLRLPRENGNLVTGTERDKFARKRCNLTASVNLNCGRFDVFPVLNVLTGPNLDYQIVYRKASCDIVFPLLGTPSLKHSLREIIKHPVVY